MNENADPLDVALAAFQRMEVPPPPPDGPVLAALTSNPRGVQEFAGQTTRWRRPYLAVAGVAAAVVLAGGVAFYLWNRAPGGSLKNETVAQTHLAPQVPATLGRDGSPVAAATQGDDRRAAAHRTEAQRVASAAVIVVAMALDAKVAPPKVRGDFPEYLIRYQVQRVLKGELHDEIIVTRTPTSPEEFIGKEWILMLSPEYMEGKHQYADTSSIKSEETVKGLMATQGQQ